MNETRDSLSLAVVATWFKLEELIKVIDSPMRVLGQTVHMGIADHHHHILLEAMMRQREQLTVRLNLHLAHLHELEKANGEKDKHH